MPDVKRLLPISIQTFSQIIERDCAYVDKTAHALALIENGKAYFLSRPRRFGKSLFVDTLKELFEGSEALFRGLYIHDRWDWEQRYPVIVLDFAAGVIDSRAALDQRIRRLIEDNGERLDIECDWHDNDIPGCFGDLIRHAHTHYGQPVVVLVDEYDKPILDNIDHPERAAEIREGLKNLYSVLKAQDAHLRFVFMTGVTKFSKVSLFSGLNQLRDITLSPQFATICGYTQSDLESTFGAHLAGVDWDEVRRWYNGYAFLGEPVYNPYDILLFISENRSFRNYWFETGSPSFLIKLFRRRRYFLPSLEQIEVSEEILDSFDVERINPITLLFQSGYLTVESTQQTWGELSFRLRIPNQEVRTALNNQFIAAYAEISDERLRYKAGLAEALTQGDLPALVAAIKRLFAAIPWRNFTGNTLPEAEGYYASVLYAFLASLNAEIIPEDLTNHGQVDLTVRLAGYIYVMELKLDRGAAAAKVVADEAESTVEAESIEVANPALAQIQARGYSDKYRGAPGRGLFEVGLVFGSAARNLIQADWRRVA
ncbi:ATP-binding protein [Allochromatium palmeri]|uniref:AAA family ATPase n=1 Tax=Allochromatium palmeri TaxID=231048 RepID=A0A6N8EGH8_9GAMM|nr:ATP-binding protein [Allochromatium palmeri]MTW22178.1 AAA family ATPase [Allochromatium palmeri]